MEIRDYEKILDSMPETGVYVVREEDRGILYFNRRAAEVSRGVSLGVPCHKAWTGSCASCPLDVIGEERECRSISYNASYGGVVEITATRTTWEGGIPAFVVTVVPRMDSGGYTYRKILHVDLEKDRCNVLKSDTGGWEPGEGPLSKQLVEFAMSGAIHREDVERMVAFARLEHLRSAHGKDALILLYRRRADTSYRWNLMELIPDQNGGSRYAILCVKDVHDVLLEGQERARTQRDMQMAAILRSRFKMMSTVFLDSGQCERVDLSCADGLDNVMVGDYTQSIQRAMASVVHPDDLEHYWSVLSLDHLREKAAAIVDYSEEVCCYRMRTEPVQWIEQRVMYTREKDQVMVNILGQDVTREKRQEESRLKALEDRAYIISSLSSLFFSTYYVDLEQDIFRPVTQLRRVGDVLGDEVNCTAALSIYANHFIHPDDRAEYLRVMNVDHLRRTLRWWKPYTAVEYRKLSEAPGAAPDSWSWVRATAVLARTGADDMPRTAVYVAQDIGDSKRKAAAETGAE